MKMTVIFQAPYAQTCMGYRLDADYAPVWLEPNDERSIDQVWTRFQRIDIGMEPPEGYKGRSLSIGDVVGIGDQMFTPEFVGWYELDEEERRSVLLAAARNLRVRGAEIDVEA